MIVNYMNGNQLAINVLTDKHGSKTTHSKPDNTAICCFVFGKCSLFTYVHSQLEVRTINLTDYKDYKGDYKDTYNNFVYISK